ncbi:signal peptidase II [Caldanaerobacter subterraneus subsp. tengcongensis MB4]|uniref:Lipoprotein signal peptidase n=1 Tax=Caldanaerobacter subterraneus subsp. tengcongensis (strain DSM 15242 / JCM 11007 / NBRC 100824 / MB4) TaxID=273068 RepID=LSPA_CALS4|nr:signal peptidase II [Caldanaerobacter subterraneus]Q8R9R0.1 RecName: Full=Lipoprotein signal peptidase; AltName: Full=Prolipoprotein signal peptidase; AltName: Full=Signal peptidase II; Short=SPase II [Caldanaerobacter subterraneus subsp. tengcongensis MB4]AAM24750.1 Lipoprotein signal peptidase [Caldanaerobacter subterraneus subsp. tengcongensis MB4]MCS3915686.1 signal peptidase II [Caldanaerobacter subterraneus subsp. tengcongensis MB4]
MAIVIVAFVVFLDQFTKYLAAKYLMPIGSYPVIKHFFHLTYVENRGAAFGMLQNKTLFFIVITVVVGIVLIYSMIKLPENSLYNYTLAMILGGAIGNLIDRVRLGYVVDFIDFKFFPAVFNVADSFIVVGAIILGYLMIFKGGIR